MEKTYPSEAQVEHDEPDSAVNSNVQKLTPPARRDNSYQIGRRVTAMFPPKQTSTSSPVSRGRS
ncbi:MAG: hypothetical protein ACI93T_003133 [Porticoccaceae bacterium]|jgi:hypothetical protein